MKIIGLTGGMGVGKSTIASLFKEQGFPIYNSDIRAKELMVEDLILKEALSELLGVEAYVNGELNKEYIAKKIFSDKELLKKQNALVHFAVRQDFLEWVEKQETDFCIKEAAILFESGAYKDCDYTIVVTAQEEIRIQRIIARDDTTEGEIRKRLQNQWSQQKLIELADFQIENNSDFQDLKIQINKIIKELKKIN